MKRWRLVVADTEEQMRIVFFVYGTPLMAVPSFKHLGHIIFSTDDICTEVDLNLQWVQGKWGRIVSILGREGADKRTAGKFYVVVVQAVLLFGSETWVVTPRLGKALAGFHHQAVHRMAGMVPECQLSRTWVHSPRTPGLGNCMLPTN